MLKLVLVGETSVGKSSLLMRFTDGVFEPDISATIGVDFKLKMMNINGKRCKATVWDTAGQERFRTLTSSYYRGAHGIILVYDVTRPETLTGLGHWLGEIESYTPSGGADVVKVLVGNKIDRKEDRAITTKEGEAFARAHGMIFVESSAKSSENVKQVFDELVTRILESPVLLAGSAPPAPASRIGFVRPEAPKPPVAEGASGGGGCCG